MQHKSNRYNVYLKADANRALEILFARLQERGDIPKNATVEDIGTYRAQIITHALLLAAYDLINTGEK